MDNHKSESPPNQDWMTPIEPESPCGPDLEYDPEFIVLSGRAATRMEAQYGDFVGQPEPVNWGDIDRDCRRLMKRAKDMRLAVLFTRCRTRLMGAAGLGEGLELLADWLKQFPEQLHPQLSIDPDPEAAREIRMNALQTLVDADGLMADLREIVLSRSSAARLQVRDVERAFAQPRPQDALAPESVMLQLADLCEQNPTQMAGFVRARTALAAIRSWGEQNLQTHQPDLSTLSGLLDRIVGDGSAALGLDMKEEAPVKEAIAEEPVVSVDTRSPTVRKGVATRQDAQAQIRIAREWFEQHEPSSPVVVLLKQAERLVGKRFAEVFNAIPPDLLSQWDGAEQ